MQIFSPTFMIIISIYTDFYIDFLTDSIDFTEFNTNS